jgi:hypothetical protein
MSSEILDQSKQGPAARVARDGGPPGVEVPAFEGASSLGHGDPDSPNIPVSRADAQLIARMLLSRVRLERKKLRNAEGKPDRPLHPALLRRMHHTVEQNARIAAWLTSQLSLPTPRGDPDIHAADLKPPLHCPTCVCERRAWQAPRAAGEADNG